MKTRFQSIGVLDLRGLTEEKARDIERVEDIGTVLLTERSREVFRQLRVKNVGTTFCLPEGVCLSRINGTHHMEAGMGDGAPVFLMVNGTLDIAREVTVEQLRAQIAGGVINGMALGAASQIAALHACGVSVNGAVEAYPDDCTLRNGYEPVELAEAQRMVGKVYLRRRVELQAGVPTLLKQNGAMLHGSSGLVYQAAERDAIAAVWNGSGTVREIPQGTRYVAGDLWVDARNAYRLRGKLMIDGGLVLQADVPDAALDALEALHVFGKALVPARLLDALLGKLTNEPDMRVYEGTLLRNEGELELSEAMLSALPEAITLLNDGTLTLAEGLPIALLRQKLRLLLNSGVVTLTAEQKGALLPLTVNDGVMQPPGTENQSEHEEPLSEGVNLVAHLGEYIL